MSDLKIQGVVEVSTENVESSFNRVGSAADQMSKKIEASADKAGKAVDGIGDGADKSAENFTRAEGKISASIKRATTQLEQLGKTASQKLEMRINTQGLDAAKFEPMLAKLREIETAQARVGTSSRGMGGQLQNTSYQLQDFIVQVNGGVDASKALGMQLPQLLVGFGAAGAAVGVLAALLPNLVSAFSDSATGAKDFKSAMSDFDKAIGDVGSSVKTFDMDKLYEEFNASSGAVRAATLEQLNFQREYIRTTQLVAGKKFGESLGGMGDYSTLDKLAGSFASSGAEKLSKQLGVSVDLAKDLLPVLNGLKSGTEDVGLAFNKFGTALLGGNQKAVDLAQSMATLSKSERDAAAAASAISEAQEKMAKGHVQTKKEKEEANRLAKESTKAAEQEAVALQKLIDTINGKSSKFDANYVQNVEALLSAYGKGKLTLGEFNEVFARYRSMQPGAVAAEKELTASVKSRSELLGKMAEAENKRFESLTKTNDSLSDEISLLGLNKDQQGEYRAAKLESAAASDLATASAIDYMKAEWEQNGALPEIIAGYESLAEAKRASAAALSDQASLIRQKAAKEIAVDQAKDSAKAWEKFSDDINRSLTDALYRAFESGDSFGEAFAKSLQNTFKTMALKLAVNYVVNGAGQLVGSIGNSAINAALGTSGANGGSGTNYLGMISNANTAYGMASGSYLGYMQAAQAGYGMTAAESAAAAQAYYNAGYYGTGMSLQAGQTAGGALGSSAAGSTATTGAGASAGAMGLTSALGYFAVIGAIFNALTSTKTRYLDTAIRGTLGEEGLNAKIADRYKNTGTLAISSSVDENWRPLTGDDASLREFYANQYASMKNPDSLVTYGYLRPYYEGMSPAANDNGTLGDDTNFKPWTQAEIDSAFAKYMDSLGGKTGTFAAITGSGESVANELQFGGEVKAAFEAIYKGVKSSLVETGKLFDDNSIADKLKGFVKNIDMNFEGSITDMLTNFGESLAQEMGAAIFPSVNALSGTVDSSGKKIQESWVQTFSRLVSESNVVSGVLDAMGRSLSQVFGKNNADNILKMSDSLVKLFGSVDSLGASFEAYYQNFYTEAEKSARSMDALQKQFESVGLTLPKTRDAFRQLVEAQDLNTESGQRAFYALIGLQGAFAQLVPVIDNVASAASAAAAFVSQNQETQAQQVTKYLQAQRQAQVSIVESNIAAAQSAADSAISIAETFKQILDSLTSYRSSLIGGSMSTLSPADKYAEAKRTYESTASKARLGDKEAASNLQAVTDAFLSSSRDVGTAGSYAFDFSAAIGTLDSVIGTAGRNVSIYEQQLQVAQAQLSSLEAIRAAMESSSDSSGLPLVVNDYQQAAQDWSSWFATTTVGQVQEYAIGTVQRISDTMGMFIDKQGTGYTFSANDGPYALAEQSAAWAEEMKRRYGQWTGPSFAVGTDYVPSTGLAMIHEGERIIPAADNQRLIGLMQNGSDNSELIAEVRMLREEVTMLRSEARATANHTSSLSSNIQRLMPDGDALAVRAAA